MTDKEWSVHDQPDFERVYDDDEPITIRRGDLQALLDLATGSMDFGSGFWDNEQVEIARKIAPMLGVDPMSVTPGNFTWQYGCLAKGTHQWQEVKWERARWYCAYADTPQTTPFLPTSLSVRCTRANGLLGDKDDGYFTNDRPQ